MMLLVVAMSFGLGARSAMAVDSGVSPVKGANVYLFAAGNGSSGATSYGAGASPLLDSIVLTANGGTGGLDGQNHYVEHTSAVDGSFSFQTPSGTNKYHCPTAVTVGGLSYTPQVYAVVVGGDGGGGTNGLITLIAALGPCSGLTTLNFTVNEITTVAAVWALQQFMSPPTGILSFNQVTGFQIGAPTSNLQGMANAFATANSLATLSSGTTASPLSGTTIYPEYQTVNTLGDMLAYCVESSPTTNLAYCSNLFTSVKAPASMLGTDGMAASNFSQPGNTAEAAWWLAQFPANIGASGGCGTAGDAFACISSTPYTPKLTASPTDWTIAVGYAPQSGGTNAIGSPFWVALDGYGNAWLTNTTTSSPANSVVELGPTGSVIMTPVTSYSIGNTSGYAATLAATYSGFTITGGSHSFASPRFVTIDSSNSAWVTNYADATAIPNIDGYSCPVGDVCDFGSVAKFTGSTNAGSGASTTAAGYFTGYRPFAGAADVGGNVYFTLLGSTANPGSKAVAKMTSSTYTLGAGLGPDSFDVAVDNNTTITNGPLVWVANQKTCAIGSADVGGVSQIPANAITAATANSMVAGTTGCSSDIRDTFSAVTGAIQSIAADVRNNIWMVSASTLLGTTTAGAIANNSITYTVPNQSTGKVDGTLLGASSVTTAVPGSGAGVGGLNNPQYVALDGAGNAWVSNYAAGSVSAFSVTNPGQTGMAIHALSSASGFAHSATGSAIVGAEGIGIDLSGNVWIANNGVTGTTPNYVTVLVGAAVPAGPVRQGQTGVTPEMASNTLPVITSFQVSKPVVNFNDTPVITWTTENATSTSMSVNGVVQGTMPTSPWTQAAMQATTVYTLTATNLSGTVISTLVVPMSLTGGLPVATSSTIPFAQSEDGYTNFTNYNGEVYFTWAAKKTPFSVYASSSAVPNVPSFYVPFSRSPTHVTNLNEFIDAHPDWIMYTCDASGVPPTNRTDIMSTAYGYIYGSSIAVPLDISNPDVLDYFFTNYIQPALDTGYPVVALDNVSLKNWDNRCGHFAYNTVENASPTTFYPVYENTNDLYATAYMNDVVSWISRLTAKIHTYVSATTGLPTGVVGNISYPVDDLAALPLMRQMVQTTDMWLEEDGETQKYPSTGVTGYLTDSAWASKFSFVRSLVGSRYYLPEHKTLVGTSLQSPLPSGTTAPDPAQVNWAVSNFLLYREADSMLTVMAEVDASHDIDRSGNHLDIVMGSPTSDPFPVVSGAWERLYSGGTGHTAGLVLVNPSGTAGASVTLPSGTWTLYNPPTGIATTWSGTINVPAHTGMSLYK